MSVFSDAEIQYLEANGSEGSPPSATTACRTSPGRLPLRPDTDTIDIGGHHFAQRKKFRDVERMGMADLPLSS
jgi:hypothetical protein